MENGRLEVLRRLEAGEIDAEEALGLLNEMRPGEPGPGPCPEAAGGAREGEVISAAPLAPALPERHWRRFWLYPLGAALGFLVLGGLILALLLGTGAARGWQVCGWIPIGLGVIGVLFAEWSRGAKWLHVRVKQPDGKRIAISLPVPLTLAAWALRIAEPFVPQLKDTGADEMILAFRDTKRDEPLHVRVDEPDGDQVEVYIG